MAIDYTLAKELLDAGFPQGGNGTWVMPPDKLVLRRDDRIYFPTLSELIEACGAGFGTLRKANGRGWVSDNGLLGVGQIKTSIHDTPEEAVVRLWLALQKNAHHRLSHL